MMKKRSRIPTILGVILLVSATFLGVFLVNYRQIFKLGAESDISPKDIRTSNVSDNSFTISWISDKETQGFVTWGESASSTSKIAKETEGNEKFFTHNITLTGLKSQTTYFYKINSDGTLFDNSGVAWQITTGSQLDLSTSSNLISGSVLTATGQPVKRGLVYANIGGYLLSTLTSDTGNFVFQLANVRTQDLTSFVQIDPAQTLIELFAQAGPEGVSTAQVYPQSAKPIPPMILGQVHDFRNSPPSQEGQVPNASLNLPAETSQESKFAVPQNPATPASSGTVTLESIKEGEVVTSTQPEFFGKGPSGQAISIKVESETPQETQIQIPGSGSWKWSPPAGLAAGAHTIIISWKDASGITRSLTRTFVVQASEGPAFESTPSQSLAPTATPTTTPKASPSATATASAVPVPQTGSLTPTLLLSIMGIAVIAFSIFIWKYAQSI